MREKREARKFFLERRKQISSQRRSKASHEVCALLSSRLETKERVLSYVPLFDEVDVSLLNDKLASRRALILPRIDDHQIKMYLVSNLENSLLKGNHGFLEPISERCAQVTTCEVALVPGVAFDRQNNRIGFGFGYFDRFLQANPLIYKIGIAFKEQVSSEQFAMDEYDVGMDEICIV